MNCSVRKLAKSLSLLSIPLWMDPLGWKLAYYESVILSHLGTMMISASVLLMLPGLAAAVWLVIGPILLLLPKRRFWALRTLTYAGVFLSSLLGGLNFGHRVWRQCVNDLVARSQPLVSAIQAFSAQNGKPPETLQELTPNYLESIPSTGIGAFPEFHYVSNQPTAYLGNLWVVCITPPCPVMGFDSLLYFPLQNYPRTGFGGVVELIGNWGYVHE